MAGSRYAYVKHFELPDPILPNTFVVVRLDGHSFHRFSDEHKFEKPNDERALKLMDQAAKDLMALHKDIVLAFGESDEFSFLLRRSTQLFNRRHSKILTTLTSEFTSSYVFHWSKYFPGLPLLYPPSFDGRIILYPSEKEIRDYFSWRQVDTHINNLYNTVFWALVQQGGQTTTEAHETLKGTVSSAKHEILFSRFRINYNELPARYRKGSILVREEISPDVAPSASTPINDKTVNSALANATKRCLELDMAKPVVQDHPTDSRQSKRKKSTPPTIVEIIHIDLIKDEFWNNRPNILNG